MTSMPPTRFVRFVRTHRARLAVTALLLASGAPSSGLRAVQIHLGPLEGSFDTTLSVGSSYRLSDPDRMFYGTAAGGLQNSVNTDDGNLNYTKGISSLAGKGTSDLGLKYE